MITSADERTWKHDRPVVFLGEWCVSYDRRGIWESMDSVVATPYGLGKIQKDSDFTEARDLETKLFPELLRVLSVHHEIQHNEKFWRIAMVILIAHFKLWRLRKKLGQMQLNSKRILMTLLLWTVIRKNFKSTAVCGTARAFMSSIKGHICLGIGINHFLKKPKNWG